MQPIQRTPCPDRPASSAACLAALIDERAMAGGVPADPSRGPGAAPSPADGTVLIWMEGAAGGPGPAAAERSFVVSYPVEAGSQAQRIPAVLGLLRAKGWSLLASRRRTTATGHANTAVPVNAGPGGEQRLWLAEPVPASRAQGRARKPGMPPPLRPAAAPVAMAVRRRARAWTGRGPGDHRGA